MTWNTPRILKAGGAAIGVASLVLTLAAIFGARAHRHELQVIGRDSAPSIIAAQHIGTALADMDATAADEDRSRFDARRTEAVSSLITAAENITYGDAERIPIRKLGVGIGTYTAMVQNARDKRDIALFRQAEQFMDAELLPAAAALERANHEALEATWAEQKNASQRVLFLLIGSGMVLGGILIAMQVFLAQRVRRIFNAGLLGATLITWIFVVYAGQSFNAADRDLRTAKQDAFDSILALWQARALAYSANADRSRALLDSANAALHKKAFDEKDRQIRESIGIEINNVTFPGEREAAEEMQSVYSAFVKNRDALPRLDEAIEKTLRINQTEFDDSVAQGFRDTANFEISGPLAGLGVCFLSLLGLRSRIREYSF